MGYEGDTCSFTCNTGYELTGSDTRTCQSDGSWSGSDDVCRKGTRNTNFITAASSIYIRLNTTTVCSYVYSFTYILYV